MTAAKQRFVTFIIWGAIASVAIGFAAAAALGAVAFMLMGDGGSVSAGEIGFVYGPATAFIVVALVAFVAAIRYSFEQNKRPVLAEQVSSIRKKFWLSVVFVTVGVVVGAHYYYVRFSAPPASSGICQVDSMGNCLPGQISPTN